MEKIHFNKKHVDLQQLNRGNNNNINREPLNTYSNNSFKDKKDCYLKKGASDCCMTSRTC